MVPRNFVRRRLSNGRTLEVQIVSLLDVVSLQGASEGDTEAGLVCGEEQEVDEGEETEG